MATFDINSWFWIVGGDASQMWSSAKPGFVPDSDATFLAFTAQGNAPSSIASLEELSEVFEQQYPAGMLSTYATSKRYAKEIGGITVSGVPVATDDRSKQMILGARLAAQADSNWSTSWVAADGSIVPVNASTIIAISDAVQAHVNDCFTTFALVKADIDSGTITTIAEIDAAFAA